MPVVCPSCDSEDTRVFRSPTRVFDYTVRRHRCQSCRTTFMSVQVVLSDQMAAKFLALIETPIQQTSISGVMPSDWAIWTKEGLVSLPTSETTT